MADRGVSLIDIDEKPPPLSYTRLQRSVPAQIVPVPSHKGAHLMELVPPPALRGRRILLVESEAPLLRELMSALENEGAETVYVTDPYSDTGVVRMVEYTYCAAAINSVHRSIAKTLRVPVLVYGPQTEVPAGTDAIMLALKALLSEE